MTTLTSNVQYFNLFLSTSGYPGWHVHDYLINRVWSRPQDYVRLEKSIYTAE